MLADKKVNFFRESILKKLIWHVEGGSFRGRPKHIVNSSWSITTVSLFVKKSSINRNFVEFLLTLNPDAFSGGSPTVLGHRPSVSQASRLPEEALQPNQGDSPGQQLRDIRGFLHRQTLRCQPGSQAGENIHGQATICLTPHGNNCNLLTTIGRVYWMRRLYMMAILKIISVDNIHTTFLL